MAIISRLTSQESRLRKAQRLVIKGQMGRAATILQRIVMSTSPPMPEAVQELQKLRELTHPVAIHMPGAPAHYETYILGNDAEPSTHYDYAARLAAQFRRPVLLETASGTVIMHPRRRPRWTLKQLPRELCVIQRDDLQRFNHDMLNQVV